MLALRGLMDTAHIIEAIDIRIVALKKARNLLAGISIRQTNAVNSALVRVASSSKIKKPGAPKRAISK